jgi:hypothetical protein
MRKFNLSLDDYSPHPRTDNLTWCNKLIERYPNIKIDLFVPAAYCRLGEQPNYLSKNLEWVDKANTLRRNYGIGLHGLYHRRTGTSKPNSNNDEFQYLSYSEANRVIDRMMDEFHTSGLKYKMVFRPPGWKVSASAATVLTKRGFIIAGDSNYHKQLKVAVPNMKWISYNWDMTKPCDINGDIFAYGHTSDWTNNYMNEERFNLICDVLDTDDFDFRFIEELV